MSSEEKVIRKLRAILSADVKGYSLLMADDEAYNKCIEISPNNWGAHVGMVAVYGHMGDKENAIKAISELHQIYPDFSKTHFLNTLPFKIESSRDVIDEGLSKAGLTE